jgi:hypothetical protein
MALSPWPQEMREAAPLMTALAFLRGDNPYALAGLPGPANVYGPLYPLLAVPFAWALGPGLPAMRLANAAAILAATAILYAACRREGAARVPALLGSGLALAGWLYFTGPTVRPDGVGLALMLGGCAVFARDPLAWRGFGLALALWLLAVAAKLYFVFPAPVAIAWVLWRGRVRRAVGYGAVAAAGLVGTIVGLAVMFPGWPVVALGANLGATAYDLGHLMRQSRDWALFSLPLLVALALAARRLRPDPWGAWALGGCAALLASLGGHPGAHMTYFFHLLTPFAVVAATAAIGDSPLPRRTMAFAVLPTLLLNAHWFPASPSAIAAGAPGFAEAARLIAGARAPLATTEFAPLLLAVGHAPTENGHADYFPYALAHPPPMWAAPLWPPRPLLEARAAALTGAIQSGLAARRYDLVLTNRFGFGLIPRDLLQAHYRVVGELPVRMPWADQAWSAEIWRPRGD